MQSDAVGRLQAWLDAEDASHFGQHDKDIETLIERLAIADPALAAAQAEVARLTAEVERLRGPVTTYKRGYGPGDGDSATLAAQEQEQTND